MESKINVRYVGRYSLLPETEHNIFSVNCNDQRTTKPLETAHNQQCVVDTYRHMKYYIILTVISTF